MILRITSIRLTTKFPAHSALLKQKQKTFGRQPSEKNIFANKTNSNEFHSVRKTVNNKIKTFSPALEILGHYCM